MNTNILKGFPRIVWENTRDLTYQAMAIGSSDQAGFVKFVYLTDLENRPFRPVTEWHLSLNLMEDDGRAIEHQLRTRTQGVIPEDAKFHLGFAGYSIKADTPLIDHFISYADKVYFSFSRGGSTQDATPTEWIDYYESIWNLVKRDVNVYLEICSDFCNRISTIKVEQWDETEWQVVTLLRYLPSVFIEQHTTGKGADIVRMLLDALEAAQRDGRSAIAYHCANVLEWIGYAYKGVFDEQPGLLDNFLQIHLTIIEDENIALGTRIEAIWSLSWLHVSNKETIIQSQPRLTQLLISLEAENKGYSNANLLVIVKTALIRGRQQPYGDASEKGAGGWTRDLTDAANSTPEVATFDRLDARKNILGYLPQKTDITVNLGINDIFVQIDSESRKSRHTLDNSSFTHDEILRFQHQLVEGIGNKDIDSVVADIVGQLKERFINQTPEIYKEASSVRYLHLLRQLSIPFELLRTESEIPRRMWRSIEGHALLSSTLVSTEAWQRIAAGLKFAFVIPNRKTAINHANTIIDQLTIVSKQMGLSIDVTTSTINGEEDFVQKIETIGAHHFLCIIADLLVPRDHPDQTHLLFGKRDEAVSLKKLRRLLAKVEPSLVVVDPNLAIDKPVVNPSIETAWIGISEAIIESGVPSSIIYRWFVSAEDSIKFLNVVLEELLNRGDIPLAVANGTRAMSSTAMASPVLIHP